MPTPWQVLNQESANETEGSSFGNLAIQGGSYGPSPVPEPGTWAAAVLLVGEAAFMRWRKRVKS